RDGGQKFILHPARRFGFLARLFLLQQESFALLLGVFALGNVTAERQPAMFSTKVHWLGGDQDLSQFSLLPPDRELEVTNETLLLQDLHRTRTRRRIRVKSELKSTFSEDFIASITAHGNEAVVHFKKDGVLNPADDQAIRTGLERLCKSLLALA